ncbi:MAG: hypothetical protein JXJ04_02495 [Spirochaetales bacterium]|nr:hypothetical protein [Spirochaetales bacterium]
MEELKYLIVTCNIHKYLSKDGYHNPGMSLWLSVFNGDCRHARSVVPGLRDGDYDIIHIDVSEDDIELINIVREKIGAKTKIIASCNLSKDNLNHIFPDKTRLSEKLVGADIITGIDPESIRLLFHVTQRYVVELPHPVNERFLHSLIKKESPPYFGIIVNSDELNRYRSLMDSHPSGLIPRFILFNSTGTRIASLLPDDKKEIWYDNDILRFCTFLLDCRVIYMPSLSHSSMNPGIFAAALGIPLMWSTPSAGLSTCFPDTFVKRESMNVLPKRLYKLTHDPGYYNDIAEKAKKKAEPYFIKNSKSRFLEFLYWMTWDSIYREKSIWRVHSLCRHNNTGLLSPSVLKKKKIESIVGCNTHHDGGTVFLRNSHLVSSIESEKDSHFRYRTHFNELDEYIRSCINDGNKPDCITMIGEYLHNPYFGTDPGLLKIVEREFCGIRFPVFLTTHERAHIFCSYGMSPFPQGEPCYMLTWEGRIGKFYKINKDLSISAFQTVFANLGDSFSCTYSIAGNKPLFIDLTNAGKIMALAGFASGRARSDKEYLMEDVNLMASLPDIWDMRKYENGHHPVFKKLEIYHKGVESRIFKDFAWKYQDMFFNLFYEFALMHCTENLPLLIGGGCGLNCEWNTRWRDCGLFPEVFVPPCTNDSGIAIGAAIDAQYYFTKNAKISWSVFSGEEFVMDQADVSNFAIHDLDYEEVVHFLHDTSGVIAWVQGKYEIGPRALCHRSLLASPLNKEMHTTLNRIKEREQFRPIAPVCPEEDVGEFFRWQGSSPYMLYFQKVLSPELKAVTHVDGTARVQTVTEQENKRIYDLLQWCKKRTGCPVLCNTSLNFKGKGFINRLSDLVKFVLTTEVGGMVIEDKFYIKK